MSDSVQDHEAREVERTDARNTGRLRKLEDTPEDARRSAPEDTRQNEVFGASLNDAQRLAATFGDSSTGAFNAPPLLIIAGAGTGKTNTLAHRVAHLIVQGVPPARIALMTFSRRASRELINRAESIVLSTLGPTRQSMASASARHLWSGTFHSIGNRLLRLYAENMGLDPNFSVIDRGDSADLVDLVRQDLGLGAKGKRFPRKDTCLSIYSHRVNTRCSLEDTLKEEYPWCLDWHDELNELFRKFVAEKQRQQLLDYDDLLLYWHALVQDKDLAATIGDRFDHILVDEYQDTNTLQAEILSALKPAGQGVCVVGDDAQSIYSFRAATVDNILDFPSMFTPAAETITLEQNYRSKQTILDSANALIGEGKRQYQKRLTGTRGVGRKPRYVLVQDEPTQANYVVEEILSAREDGIRLRDQAVLIRRAHDSDLLELELVRRDIPYVKYGGLKFLEAAHVKDVLAILRFVENPKNALAGFRTLQLLQGVGPATAERLLNDVEGAANPAAAMRAASVPANVEGWEAFLELYAELAQASDWAGQMTRVRQWYEPQIERLHGGAHVRIGDLEQLEGAAAEHRSREAFLSELTLDPPQSSSDETDDALLDEDYLILSTVHSAKGQEWRNVYMLNVTDGNYPNEFAADDEARVEEERRLLYVGMTRAQDDLQLIVPFRFYVTEQHRFGDKHLYGAKSRFITDAVMDTLDATSWPLDGSQSEGQLSNAKSVDVKSKLLSMWD